MGEGISVFWNDDQKRFEPKFGESTADYRTSILSYARDEIVNLWRDAGFEPSLLKLHLHKVYFESLKKVYDPSESQGDLSIPDAWDEWICCLEWMLTEFKSPTSDSEIDAIHISLVHAHSCRDNLRSNMEKEENFDASDWSPLKISSGLGATVISRIFQAMKNSGIVSTNTEAKRIAQLFFSTKDDQEDFANDYYTATNRAPNSVNKSPEFFEFVKLVAEQLNDNHRQRLIDFLLKSQPR